MLVMTLARNYLDFTLTGKSSANCHIKPKKSLLIISFRTRRSEKMSVKTEDSVGAAGEAGVIFHSFSGQDMKQYTKISLW